uniref:Uncharacterized protein n=2 Tax=Anguilla anguilla TaxID=7936 RepID=A0A0E9RZL5_ANGAN
MSSFCVSASIAYTYPFPFFHFFPLQLPFVISMLVSDVTQIQLIGCGIFKIFNIFLRIIFHKLCACTYNTYSSCLIFYCFLHYTFIIISPGTSLHFKGH